MTQRWRRLSAAARRDPWTKLLALTLACLVWYLTNVRERDAERVMELPVVMRRVPRQLVVTDWPLERATVTVRGPGPLLDGIDERRSRLVVPLGTLEEGENVIDLKSARIEPELPGSLALIRVQPGRATVVATVVKKRSLPVRPVTAGKVAGGYQVTQIDADPPRVDVSGPAREVDELEDVATVPIHLDGAVASIATRAFIEWAGDFVTFVPDRVTVRITIAEVAITRQLADVAIEIHGATPARVEPPTVSLTIRAPASVLEDFALPPDSVYVDVTGLDPGEHQVAVTIALPPEVEVVTRRPEVHRVVIEESRG